jgi:hypothetical protein
MYPYFRHLEKELTTSEPSVGLLLLNLQVQFALH